MKELAIRFNIVEKGIQTQIKVKNMTPQETVGLLEMAKSQILEKLKKKTVFEISKGGKDE